MARAKVIGGGFVVLLLCCGCGKSGLGEFKEFKCEGGRFKVLMPGTPTQENLTAAGIPLKTFRVESWDKGYAVAYADIPDEILRYGSVSAKLDAAVDGMVSNVHGKLIRAYDIQLAGRYPGREVKAELPNKNGVVVARIYLVRQRFYEVLVTGPQAWATSADANKFLDSFVLID
jgi:hypothetical protein